jgi:hypothetical protein
MDVGFIRGVRTSNCCAVYTKGLHESVSRHLGMSCGVANIWSTSIRPSREEILASRLLTLPGTDPRRIANVAAPVRGKATEDTEPPALTRSRTDPERH